MSAIGSVQASGGVFTVTDASGQKQQVDLGTLMMMLNLTRTENLDKQIAVQLSEIQDRNKTLTQLTEFMAWARAQKAAGNDDGTPTSGAKLTINGETRPCQGPGSWAQLLGVQWVDVQGSRGNKSGSDLDKWNGEWDASINNIKAKIDMLNNDSQMDNIKLQNLLEKRGNAFEMATKVMQTNNQSIQSVLRNL